MFQKCGCRDIWAVDHRALARYDVTDAQGMVSRLVWGALALQRTDATEVKADNKFG